MKTLSATIIQCEARELLLYKYLGKPCFGFDVSLYSFYLREIEDVEEWNQDCILVSAKNERVVIAATQEVYIITAMG